MTTRAIMAAMINTGGAFQWFYFIQLQTSMYKTHESGGDDDRKLHTTHAHGPTHWNMANVILSCEWEKTISQGDSPPCWPFLALWHKIILPLYTTINDYKLIAAHFIFSIITQLHIHTGGGSGDSKSQEASSVLVRHFDTHGTHGGISV